MATTTALWLLLQLSDGTFPSGGFAHSGGLEAMSVLGSGYRADHGPARGAMTPDDVVRFLEQSLRQAGRAALPFVRRAAASPRDLAVIDDAYDATLPLLGPNQASRAQGRALAGAAARVWEALQPVGAYAWTGPAHHAPVFGALFGGLGLGLDETMAAYLHGSARAILSAAVRLGLLGPLEAQRIHRESAKVLDDVLERVNDDDSAAAQTSPLIEVFAALHDRLDGRMFQS